MDDKKELDQTLEIADAISAIGKKFDLPVLVMGFIDKNGMHYVRAHGDSRNTTFIANVLFNQERMNITDGTNV